MKNQQTRNKNEEKNKLFEKEKKIKNKLERKNDEIKKLRIFKKGKENSVKRNIPQ